MGRKIFVSYKFADSNVQILDSKCDTTVRDYVTKFEEVLDVSDNIYKGESEGEDLSKLTDDTIWDKLKDRIYDSTVTVIFISPGMVEKGVKERDQWIPWEVSYSLKEQSRKNKNGDLITSKTNAMLAVVLPDYEGDYSYYLEKRDCCREKCVTHHTNILFPIIRENMFNLKNAQKKECQAAATIWYGPCSYIAVVKWNNFINTYDKYVREACDRQKRLEDYKLQKNVSNEMCL